MLSLAANISSIDITQVVLVQVEELWKSQMVP